jgi:hypothetical protein
MKTLEIRRTALGLLVTLVVALATPAAAALAQSAATTISGTVQGVGQDAVTLSDGQTFALSPETRVTIVTPATPADLTPGSYVAITAQRDADGVLQASLISTFPESSRGREGQFPMQGENIMTNATIDEAVLDSISGGEMSVSFLGETNQVRLTPSTVVEIRSQGALADIVPGDNISARVENGAALTVSVNQ